MKKFNAEEIFIGKFSILNIAILDKCTNAHIE